MTRASRPGSRIATGAAFLTLSFICSHAGAQQLGDVPLPKEPLVLQEEGNFFVGGRTTHVPLTG